MTTEVQCAADGRRFTARSRDVSAAGIYLITREPLTLRATLHLEFRLPLGHTACRLDASVQRQETEDVGGHDVVGVGLLFKTIPQDAAAAIKTFIAGKAP